MLFIDLGLLFITQRESRIVGGLNTLPPIPFPTPYLNLEKTLEVGSVSTRTKFFLVLFFLALFSFSTPPLEAVDPPSSKFIFSKISSKKRSALCTLCNFGTYPKFVGMPKKFSPIKNTDPPN